MAASSKKSESLEITLKDFVPPVVFKVGRWLRNSIEEDAGEIMAPQLLAVMLTLAGLILGVLVFNILPRELVALGKVVGYNGYNVRLSEKGMQAYFRFKKMQVAPQYAETGYVLGVKDEPSMESTDTLDAPTVAEDQEEESIFDQLDWYDNNQDNRQGNTDTTNATGDTDGELYNYYDSGAGEGSYEVENNTTMAPTVDYIEAGTYYSYIY